MHLACEEGHIEVVKLLIQNPKIDFNIQEIISASPIHQAVMNDRLDIVKVLTEHEQYNPTSMYICLINLTLVM